MIEIFSEQAPQGAFFIPKIQGDSMSEETVEYQKNKLEPIKVKDLPRFTRALLPIYPYFDKGQLVEGFLAQADAFIEAVAIGSGKDRAWLDEQSVDVLTDLLFEVVEANIDFFVQRILPAIERGTRALNDLADKNGGTTG